MKRFKKYLLGLVAVLTLSMAAPQTANARVHRYFYPVDQDFYMQFVYDDESGLKDVEIETEIMAYLNNRKCKLNRKIAFNY